LPLAQIAALRDPHWSAAADRSPMLPNICAHVAMDESHSIPEQITLILRRFQQFRGSFRGRLPVGSAPGRTALGALHRLRFCVSGEVAEASARAGA
jgi:hypothetical protein